MMSERRAVEMPLTVEGVATRDECSQGKDGSRRREIWVSDSARTVELFTSRWANKELAELRCQPVGISRGTPRFKTGFRYKLARELAPDDAAWALVDQEEAFRASYIRQLEGLGLDIILGR